MTSAFQILGLLACTIILRQQITYRTSHGDVNSLSDQCSTGVCSPPWPQNTLNEVSVTQEPHFKRHRLLITLSLNINRLTWLVAPRRDRRGPLALRSHERSRVQDRTLVCVTPRKAQLSLPVPTSGVKPKTVSHMKPQFLSSDRQRSYWVPLK